MYSPWISFVFAIGAVCQLQAQEPVVKPVESQEVAPVVVSDWVAETAGKPKWCEESIWQCFVINNRIRKQRGKFPHVLSRSLCKAADVRCVEIRRRWGHYNYSARAKEQGFIGSGVRENIARHSNSTAATHMNQWEHSRGHLASILACNACGYGIKDGYAVGLYGTVKSAAKPKVEPAVSSSQEQASIAGDPASWYEYFKEDVIKELIEEIKNGNVGAISQEAVEASSTSSTVQDIAYNIWKAIPGNKGHVDWQGAIKETITIKQSAEFQEIKDKLLYIKTQLDGGAIVTGASTPDNFGLVSSGGILLLIQNDMVGDAKQVEFDGIRDTSHGPFGPGQVADLAITARAAVDQLKSQVHHVEQTSSTGHNVNVSFNIVGAEWQGQTKGPGRTAKPAKPADVSIPITQNGTFMHAPTWASVRIDTTDDAVNVGVDIALNSCGQSRRCGLFQRHDRGCKTRECTVRERTVRERHHIGHKLFGGRGKCCES